MPPNRLLLSEIQVNSRVRAAEESIATYVAALRQLAEHCDYKNSLQDMLTRSTSMWR